jgi:hypothetical protein
LQDQEECLWVTTEQIASAQQAEKAAVSLPQIDWRAKMANKHDERAERDGGKRRHEEVNTRFGGGHAVGCRTIACSWTLLAPVQTHGSLQNTAWQLFLYLLAFLQYRSDSLWG